MRLLTSFCASALLCAPFAAARSLSIAANASGEIQFGPIAEQWIKSHPVEGKPAGEVTLADMLDAHYVTGSIGAFDIRFPRAFVADKSYFDEFRDVCKALVDVHGAWLDWLDVHGGEADKARADVAALAKWVAGMKSTPGAAKANEFFSAFAGYDAVKPNFEHLRDSYRGGSALGFQPKSSKPQILLISPTRQDFVELAAVMGRFDESSRGIYWNPALIGWTELGWNELQVLSLQYPPIEPKGDDLTQGVSMSSREPKGLLENVAQRGAVGLSWHCFGQVLDAAFELGMAQAIVIDIYKENNVRSGGGGRGSISAGTEAFIPGGNPNGGALPPTNADSKWRVTAGSDYFDKPLREAQRDGAKAAKSKDDKVGYFQIMSDSGGARKAMRAPFFGASARGKEMPPADFMTDYMEFYRAYKTGFVHWMRDSGAGEGSRAKFAKLLKTVNEAGSAATFDELVKEVYEQPFSGGGPESASLEWKYLAALAAKH